jgi:Protein of unknown function (DUF5818)
MSLEIRRVVLPLGATLFLTMCPLWRSQNASAQTDQSGMEHGAAAAVSVTGCLQKGAEAGGFFITGEDGKDWELVGSSAKLSGHVGHKVTVTGHEIHRSKAEEEKMASYEKTESGGKEYSDLHVSSVKMISENCSQ